MTRSGATLLAGCLALSSLDCGWGIAGGPFERDPSVLIRPEHDFEYLGAFRFPDERSGGTNWGWGGDGMTYDPAGDPDGADDGHPGSLFAIGHRHHNLVSEISIPKPSKSRNAADLPVARTLQPFADVTGGLNTGRLTGRNLADVERFGDRLYWVLFEFYMPKVEMKTFGWASPDLKNPKPQGPWRIDGFASAATSKYLFEIPPEWAERHAPGHRIAAGRSRLVNRGSWGPALYAVKPWSGESTPDRDESIDAIELLRYPDQRSRVNGYSNADDWRDGAWITAGKKSAVLFAGTKAERSIDSGLQYYGPSGPYGCGSKGYHGEPYYGAMLLYDPHELAAMAGRTIRLSTPQPYATFQVQAIVRRKCRPILGGVAFDRERGLLYVLELETDRGRLRRPLGHVWRVRDAGLPADSTPPTAPSGLRMETKDGAVVLRWKPSTDDVGGVVYVIYRDDAPIAITHKTDFKDQKARAAAASRYQVEARDAVNNRSPRAQVAATPRS